MDPTLEAFLCSWPLDPWLLGCLAATAWIYWRGWRLLRRRGARRPDGRHLAAFLGGLAVLFLALGSPLEPFAGLLLQVHMIQHMLLMMAAPPLLLLGEPALPLLRGLPEEVRRYWVAPFLRNRLLRACGRFLAAPTTAWVLFVLNTWLWHAPALYELTLRSNFWHVVEHGCFFGTALLFWRPVIQPSPGWPRWTVLPYLFLADVQNTVLSALLAFSPRLLYPHYAAVPRLWGISPLEDQAAAGVIMWVPGSIAFLVPLVFIGVKLLYGQLEGEPGRLVRSAPVPFSGGRIPLPLLAPGRPALGAPRWDLLRVPYLGRFLRWRPARPALQAVFFVLAGAIILDGLLGPQAAPMNLAGVLPWIHWRGLVVIVLLAAGNFFCLACPFQLPRTLARKWLPGRRPWPRRLRGKWLAAGLLVVFFWAYEAFRLWDSPWWTAWIAVGYFLAAFVIDSVFQGSAFCKYVCPIGQFQFVQSMVSPLQIQVRDPDVCLHCTGKECLRGRGNLPGCQLRLFPPRKASNMDCTLCLDCVHACPHDNIGLLTTRPGAQLIEDRAGPGVGRLGRRPDLAALVLVLVFGAFANAAGMVAPVVERENRLAAALGLPGTGWVMTAGLLVCLLVVPVVLLGAATLLGRWWSRDPGKALELATRFSFALLPLGAAMWLAHYLYHFLTGAGGIIPVVQRAAADVGLSGLGEPAWNMSCCPPSVPWVFRLEIVLLELGLLLSLYVGYRIARKRFPDLPRALKAFAPWAALLLLLFTVGAWILFQPMQMRGTLTG